MPNAPLAMNMSNLIEFVAQKPVNWATVRHRVHHHRQLSCS
jgi:hypothetical protein